MFRGDGGGRGGSASTSLDILPQSLVEVVVAFCFVFLLAVPLISRMNKLLDDAGQEEDKSNSSNNNNNNINHDEEEVGWDKERGHWRKGVESPAEKYEFDYRAYRHKLMEKVLASYYNQTQPPGLVVMNSILLNAPEDSTAAVPSNLDSFFGFVDDGSCDTYEDTRPNATVNPMNHFLVRGYRREPTEEKCISTKSISLTSIATSISETTMKEPVRNGTAATGATLLPSARNENRPKTAGVKSHCVATMLETNKSRGRSAVYQQQQQRRMHDSEAELLCIDRNDQRNEERSNKLQPWLPTTGADSFNRKYSRRARDFNSLWRRSRARKPRSTLAPLASSVNESVATVQSGGATFSFDTSQPPATSPIQLKNLLTSHSLKAEVLRKMTLLSSGLDRNEPCNRVLDKLYLSTKGGSSASNVSWKDLEDQVKQSWSEPTSPDSRLTSNVQQPRLNSYGRAMSSLRTTAYTVRRNLSAQVEYNSTVDSKSRADEFAASRTFKRVNMSWQTATEQCGNDEAEQEVANRSCDPGSMAGRVGTDSEKSALDGEIRGLPLANSSGHLGGCSLPGNRDRVGVRLQRLKLAMNPSLQSNIDTLKAREERKGSADLILQSAFPAKCATPNDGPPPGPAVLWT